MRMIGNVGRQGGFIYADDASDALDRLLSLPLEDEHPLGIDFQAENVDSDGVSRWREFGRVLRTNYGIEQYAFVNWND